MLDAWKFLLYILNAQSVRQLVSETLRGDSPWQNNRNQSDDIRRHAPNGYFLGSYYCTVFGVPNLNS